MAMTRDWKSWEGQVANKFPLRQYLGGSDGTAVFLTERSGGTSQTAAIKLMLADADHPDARLSWWELTSRLSHPNLLPEFETGSCRIEETEVCYYVMEYAEEDLSRILPERALTPEETKEALVSVIEALKYVHGKGFVHGHLKASNVLAVGDHVKLSSDGLCGVGEPGKVLGPTSDYTAPEIVAGGAVSPQADVWSLGILIPEMLTQKRPGKNAADARRVESPKLPEPFLDVVNHCLMADPASRWTVAEIERRIKTEAAPPAWAAAAAVVSPPPKRGASFYTLAAAIVVAIVLTISLIARHRSSDNVEPVPSSSAVSDAQPTTTSTPSNDRHEKASIPNASSASSAASVPGRVSSRTMPEITTSASRTIQGKVRVKIRAAVDTSGNVSSAKIESEGPSKYFASKSLEAARQWKFVAPEVNGEAAASSWLITFEFSRSAIHDSVQEINTPGSSGKR